MATKRKVFWLRAAGYFACVVPPALATLEHFPLWMEKGSTTSFSAIGLLLILLCLIPFRKGLKKWLESPSAWQIWLLLWGVLYCTRCLTEGLLAVASVGLPCSILGAFFFHLAKKIEQGV